MYDLCLTLERFSFDISLRSNYKFDALCRISLEKRFVHNKPFTEIVVNRINDFEVSLMSL